MARRIWAPFGETRFSCDDVVCLGYHPHRVSAIVFSGTLGARSGDGGVGLVCAQYDQGPAFPLENRCVPRGLGSRLRIRPRTMSSFAPRKNALSRSERRQNRGAVGRVVSVWNVRRSPPIQTTPRQAARTTTRRSSLPMARMRGMAARFRLCWNARIGLFAHVDRSLRDREIASRRDAAA